MIEFDKVTRPTDPLIEDFQLENIDQMLVEWARSVYHSRPEEGDQAQTSLRIMSALDTISCLRYRLATMRDPRNRVPHTHLHPLS
jgi:hypothetical protein